VLETEADVVVGSRRHSDTEAVYRGTRLRELGSLVFNLFTHVVLLGQYRDTQSGIKGFRAEAAETIFSRSVVNVFAFDVEVLHLVERYGYGLKEIPVVLDNVDDSTVSFAADTVKMVGDVFAIRRRAALGQYDLDADRQPASEAGSR
jgi:dolichyl-phosphate beta-glucosyltransferase